MPSNFPCSPVIRECSWKKTQIEKKGIYQEIQGLKGKEIKKIGNDEADK